MLYPQAKEPLTQEQFLHPGPEYRGTPFWSWNCELSEDLLGRGIDNVPDAFAGQYRDVPGEGSFLQPIFRSSRGWLANASRDQVL